MRYPHLLAAVALVGLPLPAAAAEAPPAGARPGDKALTCEAIAAERTDIAAAGAGAKRAEAKAASAKRGKAMFGFAKRLAAQVVPGQALGIGGVGGQAAYLASGQAIGAMDGEGAAPAARAAPAPTQAETDRLARLQSIADYRQCGA